MDNPILSRFVKESFGLSHGISIEIYPLSVRGSDRTFYRIKWAENKSVILVHYDPVREENMYYADIGRFLKSLSVNVPEVFRHDPFMNFILVEDLGDIDLYSLRDRPWDVRKELYEKTIENIIKLHNYPITEFPYQKVRIMGRFDAHLYTWEHKYFLENFVKGVCGFKNKRLDMDKLTMEFNVLIEKFLNSHHSLIHRDLQSQNVIIKGSIPYLIDFQGMREGNPLYDLASILNDPYVVFSDEERYYLLKFYYRDSRLKMDFETFEELFWCASCQRLMQALGAYGYLGLQKGISAFLEHIPSGLKNLLYSVSHISFMPYLSEIVEMCYKDMEIRNFTGMG